MILLVIISMCKADVEMYTTFALLFGLILAGLVAYYLCSLFGRKEAAERQKRIDAQHELEYGQWQKRLSISGKLCPVRTDMLLAKGEVCFHAEKNVTLFEVRAIRRSNHSFGSIPIGKTGIRIGKGWSTSESSDEWRPIAKGQLYITNKQLYFDGDKQDRKIPLGNVVTLKSDLSAMEVSSETRQKSMVFVGVNGMICRDIVRMLRDG